jgi:hypothetical protein
VLAPVNPRSLPTCAKKSYMTTTAAKAFAAGQLYVALSRCTTLGGLVLRQPIDSSQVILDERVMDFHVEDD